MSHIEPETKVADGWMTDKDVLFVSVVERGQSCEQAERGSPRNTILGVLTSRRDYSVVHDNFWSQDLCSRRLVSLIPSVQPYFNEYSSSEVLVNPIES
jgi:hypothetical protein